jgi:hypothetical protein
LAFLGQPVPPELADADVAEMWGWAIANWNETNIPRLRSQGLI